MRSRDNNQKNETQHRRPEAAAVTSKRNSETHEKTLAYWTPERMRSAKPMPIDLEHSSPHKEQ